MEKIIIIGGVAAGATAAAKVRRISPSAQITMLEAGPDISFANCGLPYFIGGDIQNRSKLILQSPESFKQQYNVDVHIHSIVTSIDRKAHVVSISNSQTGVKKSFEYTKLILAQGGKPIKPTLPGADSDHVFTLWTLEDMDKITKHLDEKKPKTAVVVGGGFIGLEMVEALVKRGLKVNVVEMMPHVMANMEADTRVQPIGSTLQMAMLNPDWLKKFLQENPAAVRHEKVDGSVLLTAQPKELQEFLMKHEKSADAWNECEPLTRRRKPTE